MLATKGYPRRVRVSSSYEAPAVTDLGAFAELTQKGTGKAQDSAEGSGSG